MKNAATKPPRPNHTTRTATSRTSKRDNAYTSHQRYQPRSWMRPRSSFTNAAPPATRTIVVGRVFTAPNPHPTSPSANPNATITRRSRCVREMVSRSLSRCSRPVASSFQPRTREARDGRDGSDGSVLTRGRSYTSGERRGNLPSPQPELRGRDERFDRVAGLLERGPAPLLPVHYGQDAEDPSALGDDGGDRLAGRVPGGDHVLHDDDGGTGGEAAFDAPAGAVGLGLLADGEGVDDPPLGPGGGGHGVGDGIGTEGQPADQVGRPPTGSEAREPERTDHDQAFTRHGGAARIDVKTGAPP